MKLETLLKLDPTKTQPTNTRLINYFEIEAWLPFCYCTESILNLRWIYVNEGCGNTADSYCALYKLIAWKWTTLLVNHTWSVETAMPPFHKHALHFLPEVIHQRCWLGPRLYGARWRITLMLRYLDMMVWLFLNTGLWFGKGRGTKLSWKKTTTTNSY